MTTYFLEDHGGKVSDARVVVKGHRRQLQLADIVANAQFHGKKLKFRRIGAWAQILDLSQQDAEPLVLSTPPGSQHSARRPRRRSNSMSMVVDRTQPPSGDQNVLANPGPKHGCAPFGTTLARRHIKARCHFHSVHTATLTRWLAHPIPRVRAPEGGLYNRL